MPTLSHHEGVTVEIVRHQCRQGDPVATKDVIRRSPLTLDQTQHALTGLVAKGLVLRVGRGLYLPAAPGKAEALNG
jgi:hypothetical protein